MKHLLKTAPVLAYSNHLTPMCLYTYASGVGLGSLLSKGRNDGNEWVLGFASWMLTQLEINYCIRRELLVVDFGVRKYQAYVAGACFTVWTDHSTLRWLLETKDLEEPMARWIQELEDTTLGWSIPWKEACQ